MLNKEQYIALYHTKGLLAQRQSGCLLGNGSRFRYSHSPQIKFLGCRSGRTVQAVNLV